VSSSGLIARFGESMARLVLIGLLLFVSPAFAADSVIVRHLDAVLDFAAITSANCAQHYEEGLTPKAVAELHFSQIEIGAYCVCSTKLLIQEMGETDFQNLEAGNDLPMTFAPVLKKAHYNCAKKVWDARQHH
jgi:hypothetical protein